MTPPRSFRGQPTDGQKDGEPAGPCFGSRGCSGWASAPAAFRLQAPAAAAVAETPPDPRAPTAPGASGRRGRGGESVQRGLEILALPRLRWAGQLRPSSSPSLLLFLPLVLPPPLSSPSPPPASPPRLARAAPASSPAASAPGFLFPVRGTSRGDAAGAAAAAGSALGHSLPHLAPKPCVCGGSAGAREPSAGCREGELGAGPGAVRLKINADSTDPSIRKPDLSGTLLRTLLVQPSLWHVVSPALLVFHA